MSVPSLAAIPAYGYAFAAVVAAAVLGLAAQLPVAVAPFAIYLLLYPLILLAAWLTGLWPALAAIAICATASTYVLLPRGAAFIDQPLAVPPLVFFVGTASIGTWLVSRLRNDTIRHESAAVAARAQAERLDAILSTTADGVIVIDAKGCIEAFNRGAERLFGYPESEVVGRNVSLLMPSPHHEAHDSYLENYRRTGEAQIIGIGREVSGRRRDGSIFPVHLSVGEMTVGGCRKFTGLLQDLTRRVRLEGELDASEARWRAVIDSAADGIIVIDAHGRVESFNPGAERLFGYASGEVIGQNVDLLMPSPHHEQHDSCLSRYLATGRAKIIGVGREVQGRRKNGTTFPLHLSVGHLTVAGEQRFTGILHDLSQRVALESRLREQQSLAHLGEMAAVVAHEVKNPLAGIRGAMQVFMSRVTDEPSREILGDIVHRVDALDGMMKDLLLYARPPQPRRSPTDLSLLINSTAALLAQDPALHDITIDVKGSSPLLDVDPEMLRIVMHNLLINSAQAMQGAGRIAVQLDRLGTTCRIHIADDGPGIPAAIRDKVFSPFFTTKARGSGLGLATAKRLIEAHGGSIAIDCPASGGTRVAIDLPTAAVN